MHPAPSLIAFTVLSGLGFGLLTFLGLGRPAVEGWVAFTFFAIGFGLAGAGLLSSTLHLGHPERALKAFTQWRSSWLSREGWASVLALVVMGLFALTVLFAEPVAWLGQLGAALSVATVFCTSMIYAQLKTVPRWHHWSTPLIFLVLSLSGGALLAGQVTLAAAGLPLAGLLQAALWLMADLRVAERSPSLASATGLGRPGKVRLFEPPHTGGNYLTREMVFSVARKHARKLRVLSLVLAFALPALLLLIAPAHVAAPFAVLSHLAGIAVLRWLFFAEAEHVVGLYYGRPGLT